MKHVLKVVAAVAMVCLPITANAGIDFENMPIGCTWSIKYSDGKTLIETFKRKKSGHYITEAVDKRAPDQVASRTTFDKNGRMIRKDWAGGKWETFTPFSCFDVMGTCSYSYKNGDGAAFVIENTMSKQGKGFKVVTGEKGGSAYPDEYLELGQFNIATRNKSANYSAKLLGFTNCESGSS